MELKQRYKVIGLMSGTSLDGVDIACCTFNKDSTGWRFKIDQAKTFKYSTKWLDLLSKAHKISAIELISLDVEYGKLLGQLTDRFIRQHKLKPDFICSHGHTVFHQPEQGFTHQIGNGNALHATTGLPLVFDFRSLDVMLGGEGAPLVPAGDKYLFHEYDVALNLGGIANLSMDIKKQRIAFDICFANMGLNYLAAKAGKAFDRNGTMANEGEVDKKLMKSLDKIYEGLRAKRPSLGREIFELRIRPLLEDKRLSLNDRLRTFTESIALEIVRAVANKKNQPKILCTGGGTFNSFLISRMLEFFGDRATLIVPDDEIIKFKEALVFGFLGVLRVRDEANCLRSVTRATRDSSGGILVGF